MEERGTLLEDLKETFENLRRFQIKLNPEKCVFGVPAGQLLGFLVSERGIECNCRGIVTADVLGLGLSRGAIATRKLEGVMRDKEHEGLYWFGPLR